MAAAGWGRAFGLISGGGRQVVALESSGGVAAAAAQVNYMKCVQIDARLALRTGPFGAARARLEWRVKSIRFIVPALRTHSNQQGPFPNCDPICALAPAWRLLNGQSIGLAA